MATFVQSGFQPDSDVHVSFEDQQKINKFAKQNANLEDLHEELKRKQNDLQNLNDACSEMELFDENAKVPYHIGEIFVLQDLPKVLEYIEEAKIQKEKEITAIQDKCNNLKAILSELKTQLYAKFGNNISLEAEEE